MNKNFLKYWNNCYLATCYEYKQSIFYIHDIQVVRQIKLNRIIGKKDTIKIKYEDISDKITFEQDGENKMFYIKWSEMDKIFGDIRSQNYVNDILKNITNLPIGYAGFSHIKLDRLKNYSEFKIL